MYCPTCGQQQVSENSRFCSRCGFLLTGINDVIANNGLLPNQIGQNELAKTESPRKKGIKKGAWILLVGMLLITPLIAIIHIATNTEPYVMAIAAIISFFGGILRMIYAAMFEDSTSPQNEASQFSGQQFLANNQAKSLPAQQTISANDYVAPKAGTWRETNDLIERPSVVDSTTKLLQKED